MIPVKRFAAIAIIALTFSVLLPCLSYAADDVLLGRVSLVYGKSQWKPAQQADFQQVGIGQEIRNGYLLQVPDDGKVEVCYTDGAVIRFKGGSKVQFQLNALRLFDGKVWAARGEEGRQVRGRHPDLRAGVRGTVFSVEANRKSNGAVRVYESTVYTKTPVGTTDVTAGKQIEIAPTGYMTQPVDVKEKVDKDFAEGEWQASDRNTAYRRYLMLLFRGIEPADIASGDADKEIQARKKLPEVQNAQWTYEGLLNQ